MPYIDDVYFWADEHEQVSFDYSAIVEAPRDTIAQPINKEQIEIIHAQDTTVTIVVRRN